MNVAGKKVGWRATSPQRSARVVAQADRERVQKMIPVQCESPNFDAASGGVADESNQVLQCLIVQI